MGMVKFANTCEECGKRSAEYTMWPECRHCGRNVCQECGSDYECDEGRQEIDCFKCQEDERIFREGQEAERLAEQLREQANDDN